MTPDLMLGIKMTTLKKYLIFSLFILFWTATMIPDYQLDLKTKLLIKLWNKKSFMAIASQIILDLHEKLFQGRIIKYFDPDFSKDLPFQIIIFCIYEKLTTCSTMFLLHNKLIPLQERESKIFQKKEGNQDKPYYKEILEFYDNYLGQKGEDNYGVKELAKINEEVKR